MQAIILAAGSGTRLEPMTSTMSKAMAPMANRPMLDWIIETMKPVADEFIIVCRKEQEDIARHFSGRSDVKLVYQDKPLGTGHAAMQCKPHIRGDFILTNSDVMTRPEDMARLASMQAPAVAAFEVPDPQNFGVFTVSEGKATGITEKPQSPQSNLINAGIYKLSPSIFSLLECLKPSQRGEYELTDALVQQLPLRLAKLDAWVHVSYPWDILEANKFVLETWGSQIGDAEIRPGAFIEHPVAIGDGAIIGPNCYIRRHSSIGPGCKVGNAVEIKNSVIMAETFVSHLSYIGDSIIGRDCNIAAGTIFANLRLDDNSIKVKIKGEVIDSGRRKLGAVIADGVKFGVNCTVMPGRRIWPNLMIPPCTIITQDITKQPNLKDWKRILADE